MSWKDYFYFQRRDKTAIILLLLLIVVSGGIYIITEQFTYTNQDEETSALKKEFSVSQKHNQEEVPEDLKNTNYIENKKSKYKSLEKLKAGETIELNSADTSQLKKLKGIGSSYANRIVKYRKLLGGYASINQLKEVWGMDDELYKQIAPYLTIKPEAIQIKVNSASFKELNKHPYINYQQAKVIIDIRERKGQIESLERLQLLDEFNENDIKRLKPYISFD